MASNAVHPDNVNEVRETLRKIQKNLECPICLDLLSDPYTTQCSHPFCRMCIYRVISSTREAKCPLCKETITKRSMNENTRLGEIVEAVKDLEQAIIRDSGTSRTPPRPHPSGHTHEATGTPGMIIHSLTHPTPIKPHPSSLEALQTTLLKSRVGTSRTETSNQTTLLKSRVGTSHTETSNQTTPSFKSSNTDNAPPPEVLVPNELDSLDKINKNVPSGQCDPGQGTSFSKPTLRRKHRVRFRGAESSKVTKKKKIQKQKCQTGSVCASSQYRRELLDALETGSLVADVGAVSGVEHPTSGREISPRHADNSEMPANILEISPKHADNSELPANILEISPKHEDNSELPANILEISPKHADNSANILEISHADNSELPANILEISPKHADNSELPGSGTSTKPSDSICLPMIKTETEAPFLIRTTVEETPYLHLNGGKSFSVPPRSKASPVVVQETPYVRLEWSEDEELKSRRNGGKQWHDLDQGETPLISSSALDRNSCNLTQITEGYNSNLTQDNNEGHSSNLTQDTNEGHSSNEGNLTQDTSKLHSSNLTQDTNPHNLQTNTTNEVVLARETQLLSPQSPLTLDSLEPNIIAPTQVATVNETQTNPQLPIEPPETITEGEAYVQERAKQYAQNDLKVQIDTSQPNAPLIRQPYLRPRRGIQPPRLPADYPHAPSRTVDCITSTVNVQNAEPIDNTRPDVSTSRGIHHHKVCSQDIPCQLIRAQKTSATPDRNNLGEDSSTPGTVLQVKGQMNSETEDVSSRLLITSPVVMEMTPRTSLRGEYSSPTIPLQNVVSGHLSSTTNSNSSSLTDGSVGDNPSQSPEPVRGGSLSTIAETQLSTFVPPSQTTPLLTNTTKLPGLKQLLEESNDNLIHNNFRSLSEKSTQSESEAASIQVKDKGQIGDDIVQYPHSNISPTLSLSEGGSTSSSDGSPLTACEVTLLSPELTSQDLETLRLQMIQKQREVEELETALQQTHKGQAPSHLPPPTQVTPTPSKPCQDARVIYDVSCSALQQTHEGLSLLPPHTQANIIASKSHQDSSFQSTHNVTHSNEIDKPHDHQDSNSLPSTCNITHSQVANMTPAATPHSRSNITKSNTYFNTNASPDSSQVISETQFQKTSTKALSAKSESLIAAADEALRKLRSPPPADIEEQSTMEIDDDLMESSASLRYSLSSLTKTVKKRAKKLKNQTVSKESAALSKEGRSRVIASSKCATHTSTLKSPTISMPAYFVPLEMKENRGKKRSHSPPEVKDQIYEPLQKRVKFMEPVNCLDECVQVTERHPLEVNNGIDSSQVAIVGTYVSSSLTKEKDVSRSPLRKLVELDSDDLEVYSPLSPNAALSDHHPFMSVSTSKDSSLSVRSGVQMVPDTPHIHVLAGPLCAHTPQVARTTIQEVARTPAQGPQIAKTPPQGPQVARTPPQGSQVARTPPQGPQVARTPPQCPQVARSTIQEVARTPPQGPQVARTPPQGPQAAGNPPDPTTHTQRGLFQAIDNKISTDSSTTPQHQKLIGVASNERPKVVQTPSVRLSGEGTSTFRSPGGNKRHTLSFVGSGLSKPQLRQAQLLARRHGGRIASVFNGNTTHVIVVADEQGLCPRTVKYLLGVVTGIWILSYKWVKDSHAAGKLLPEEPYEVKGDTTLLDQSTCIPATARLSRDNEGRGLFAGSFYFLLSEVNGISKDQLSQLIQLGGGTIVQSMSDLRRLRDGTVYVVCDNESVWTDTGLDSGSNTFTVVSSNQIIDSISNYRKHMCTY